MYSDAGIRFFGIVEGGLALLVVLVSLLGLSSAGGRTEVLLTGIFTKVLLNSRSTT
jgi:hypothetical protein